MTILSILVTVFVDVEVVSLPLLQDRAEHEENLEKIYLCKAISLNILGQMYNSCVRGMMLYSSKCWALRQEEALVKKRIVD